MQADLLQQQREAENLSDEELLYYAQNGSPHISGLIITQVMADRAQQRQAGAAAAPPSPTVKDQVAQQLASSSQFPGITSIEQPQMATYSGGGIVGYADGGLVGYQDGGYYDPDDQEYYGPGGTFSQARDLARQRARDDSWYGKYRRYLERQYGSFPESSPAGAPTATPTGFDPRDEYGQHFTDPSERYLQAIAGFDTSDLTRQLLASGKSDTSDLTRQLLASGKLDEIPVAGMGDDKVGDEYEDILNRAFGGGLSYDPIVAATMEKPDLDAQFADIRGMVAELADPTAGEALRDQQRRGMSKELAGRRLRSQELQRMEAQSEPWRYAADIAFDREGPTLREGIRSVITEREAEQNAISDSMFAMRDAIAEAQAQRERGAAGAAAQLESEIAKLGVETAFNVAKFNASEENKAAIANLEAAIRTGIANNDANARQVAALLEASTTANPTDLVEIVRALNGTIEQLVGGQSILAGPDREVLIEDMVAMLVNMQRDIYGQIGQQVLGGPQTIGPNTISRPSGPV